MPTHNRNLLMTLFVALAALFAAASAHADGFIVPDPVPGMPRPLSLAVKYHHVDVAIRDGVAVTSIAQVFHNDLPRDLEGTYIFPLPEEAAVTDFTMYVDGKPLTGKVLPKDEARRIYESYVRRMIDPALLEYIGRDMFRARVFPIPARGDKRIQLKYSQVVPFEAGVYAYRYPLDTERFSSRPLQEVAVRVAIESKEPLKAIYSPSHEIDVQRKGDTRATASYEEKNVRPDRDFRLYYTVSEKDFGLHLIAHSPVVTEKGGKGNEGGFFLLMLAPKTGLAESRKLSKDITFVFDTSGSMSGEKIEQAKKALRFALENLNPGDRFNLLPFSGDVESFRPGLVPASPEATREAGRYVDGIEARGGTNINDALLAALKQQKPRAGAPAMIVFLTDGRPTIGATDIKEIVANVGKARVGETRLFVFGVGNDVNAHLLDRLSGGYGGVSEYVRPGEDLEVKVSSFYTKIATPVLADLSLDFGGAEPYDVYPKRLPDLFAGSQVLVLGRYRHSGRFDVTLKGSVGGDARKFAYPADFVGEDPGSEFIPRLWATRKVGFLLDELRLNGPNIELINEVTRLGMEYGIVTPYTSSLVEEEPRLAARERMKDFAAAMPGGLERAVPAAPGMPGGGGMGGGMGGFGGGIPGVGGAPMAPAPQSGAIAVDAAARLRVAKEAARAGDEFTSVRHVEGKTFRLQGGVWTDVAYKAEMKKREIRFASDEYFTLVASDRRLAKYLALGERVVVVWKDEAITVVPAPAPAP